MSSLLKNILVSFGRISSAISLLPGRGMGDLLQGRWWFSNFNDFNSIVRCLKGEEKMFGKREEDEDEEEEEDEYWEKIERKILSFFSPFSSLLPSFLHVSSLRWTATWVGRWHYLIFIHSLHCFWIIGCPHRRSIHHRCIFIEAAAMIYFGTEIRSCKSVPPIGSLRASALALFFNTFKREICTYVRGFKTSSHSPQSDIKLLESLSSDVYTNNACNNAYKIVNDRWRDRLARRMSAGTVGWRCDEKKKKKIYI